MKSLVTGAEFWDFDAAAEFSGKFISVVKRENDHPTDPTKKAGDLMGYNFEDVDGNIHIIGNSHQITKALTNAGQGVGNFYKIVFLGKGVNSKNQPFNRFSIEQYDDEIEFRVLNSAQTSDKAAVSNTPVQDEDAALLEGAKRSKRKS